MTAIIDSIEIVLPDKKILNSELSKQFPDYNFEKFQKKVGIKQRFVVDDNTSALDLAVKAVNKLFDCRKNRINEIDFIILCTQSPDHYLPTSACILQERCNLPKSAGAIDINQGCSGYAYGFSIAKGLIESGICQNVLLITAETYSKYTHPKDRTNRAIFGDAATASIITNEKDLNQYKFMFGTDGSGAEHLIIKNGCKYPLNEKPIQKIYGSNNIFDDNHLYMNGPEIFNFTIEEVPRFYNSLLEANNCTIEDLDFVVFHQANKFLLETLRKISNIPQEKFIINFENTGNTVSNTIPIALKEFLQNNNLNKRFLKILILGFGVGLSWCGGIVEYKNNQYYDDKK